jgi:hypothetical protein
VSLCISTNSEWQTFANEHIKYENKNFVTKTRRKKSEATLVFWIELTLKKNLRGIMQHLIQFNVFFG